VTPEPVLRVGWGQGACAGDFDNDGFDDLFVTYYGARTFFYHNNGDGTFNDETARQVSVGRRGTGVPAVRL